MDARLEALRHKIVDLHTAKGIVGGWQLKDNKIVFTNGCFDILHEGHVTYLAQAASAGNRLVVGLNTDNSVKGQQKGIDRPVNNENSRAVVLAALGFVDLVILFDENTPLNLIREIRPDVLAKGADYDPKITDPATKGYIVGSDIVRGYGGDVIAIPLVEGFSTTSLIKKLKG